MRKTLVGRTESTLCACVFDPCGGGVLVEILNKWRFREVFVFVSVNFREKIKFFCLQ